MTLFKVTRCSSASHRAESKADIEARDMEGSWTQLPGKPTPLGKINTTLAGTYSLTVGFRHLQASHTHTHTQARWVLANKAG